MSMELNYTQKMKALLALVAPYGEISIRMRTDGTWYIIAPIYRKDEYTLTGLTVSGKGPEHAIELFWELATDESKPDSYLVVEAGGQRTAAQWNGFMWEHIDEKAVQS